MAVSLMPESITSCNLNEKAESLDDYNLDLNAIEEELQRQYQMAVIRSHNAESFPLVKSYPPAQKESASRLYDSLDKVHFLSLKLMHAEKFHEESVKALELKWILSVVPTVTENKDDNTLDELKYWYNQMKNYDKCLKDAQSSCSDEKKFTFMGDIQLCYDVTYTQEGFQECLEFCTETQDHMLKITITYDGEISAKSSLYMASLKDVVEVCFNEKVPVNFLIRRIWALFNETFIEQRC